MWLIISSVLITPVVAAIVFKIYLKLTIRMNGCMNCLVGKTIIVTGSNTGIGYETALDFAARGARVILACRNEERARAATERIIAETGNANVTYKLLDLGSRSSIRRFANEIDETEPRLDVLVNNAAGTAFGNDRLEDDVEVNLQVNYVGPFLLTLLLVEKLARSAPSRVVNLTSDAARMRMDLETFNVYPESKDKVTAELVMYCRAKLGNLLFAVELAKRLDGTGVTVNAVNPGAVVTDFLREFPSVTKKFFRYVLFPFYKTAREGAQTTIYTSLSNDLNGVTGKMFDNCKEATIFHSARDPEFAKQLWVKTEELAKITDEEKSKYSKFFK